MQHGHHRDQHARRRREVADADAVHAVADPVEDDAQGEEREEGDLPDRAARRHPLAVAERDDRGQGGQHDEGDAERVAAGHRQLADEALVHRQRDAATDPPSHIGVPAQ